MAPKQYMYNRERKKAIFATVHPMSRLRDKLAIWMDEKTNEQTLNGKRTRSGAQVPGWYISIDIQSNQDTYKYLKKQKNGDCKIFDVQKN